MQCKQLTNKEWASDLRAVVLAQHPYTFYALDGVVSDDPSVTLPYQITHVESPTGNLYYAEYEEKPGAVLYLTLQDFLTHHAIPHLTPVGWLESL